MYTYIYIHIFIHIYIHNALLYDILGLEQEMVHGPSKGFIVHGGLLWIHKHAKEFLLPCPHGHVAFDTEGSASSWRSGLVLCEVPRTTTVVKMQVLTKLLTSNHS